MTACELRDGTWPLLPAVFERWEGLFIRLDSYPLLQTATRKNDARGTHLVTRILPGFDKSGGEGEIETSAGELSVRVG